jgi:thiol-disulfide isomerase/thioredoxin
MHTALGRFYDEIKKIEERIGKEQGQIDKHVVALKVVKGKIIAESVALAGSKKKSDEDYLMLASLDDLSRTLDEMLAGLEKRILENPPKKIYDDPDFDPYSNDRPFDELSPSLLLFYSTKCGYCHQFKPIWAELKRIYADRDINLLSIRGDGAAPDVMAQIKQFRIVGYPTLILIDPKRNRKHEFGGERTLNNLLHFIESNLE